MLTAKLRTASKVKTGKTKHAVAGKPLSRVIGTVPIKDKAKTALHFAKAVTPSIGEVRTTLGLSQLEFSRLTGYSIRSIAGWEAGRPLSTSAKQKLIESRRLWAALSQIIPANQVGEWLRTPNPSFEGQTPIQVIERGESDRLWQMIFQIDAGVAN